MFRKPRSIDELMKDPQFPYHVGRLIGAAEMSAHFMQIQKEEDTQQVGTKLAGIVDWFFQGGTDGKPTTTTEQRQHDHGTSG